MFLLKKTQKTVEEKDESLYLAMLEENLNFETIKSIINKKEKLINQKISNYTPFHLALEHKDLSIELLKFFIENKVKKKI